jgi:acetylornithine deacetylase/succinyl-diaminopimelate desuccinylase-like protein
VLSGIENEVANFLSQLIRIDTTNPPGNETKAANFLSENLGKDGIGCKIFESSPSRGSVIARLKGSGEKPRLLLLSHLDVVAANSSEWSVNPFAGTIKDGFVWGRGSLDMKGMTAIEVMALKLLKRNNAKLKGDVILAATADEEMGGLGGAEFLLQNHHDEIFAEYVLNEGGGSSISTKEKRIYTINTAEKGLLWFRVKAKGTPGHGSMPETADNAIMRMNKVIDILGNFQAKINLIPTVKEFIKELARADPSLREQLNMIIHHPEKSKAILDQLEKTAPTISDEIRPRLKMTITPTIVHGGVKENLIPSECVAVFDCRVLPGQSTAEAKALIRKLLQNVGYEKLSFEDVQVQEPSESCVDTPLYSAITNVIHDFEPDCNVAPSLMVGGTDSRFFRRRGSVCYGFHPLRSEAKFGEKAIRREHGIDERISIDNLLFGTSVLYETVIKFMT